MHRWQTCQPLSQFQRLHLLISLATTPLGIGLASETIQWGSFEEVAHTSASKDKPANFNLTCLPEITFFAEVQGQFCLYKYPKRIIPLHFGIRLDSSPTENPYITLILLFSPLSVCIDIQRQACLSVILQASLVLIGYSKMALKCNSIPSQP